jgi:hypothetical protein
MGWPQAPAPAADGWWPQAPVRVATPFVSYAATSPMLRIGEEPDCPHRVPPDTSIPGLTRSFPFPHKPLQ